MKLVEREPFYFYHLLPKDVKLTREGLCTPEFFYKNKMYDQYKKVTNKYRERLCDGIFNCFPEELTVHQIYQGLNIFRENSQGNNIIYFFRYLPYKELGVNMSKTLNGKKAYRIDLNDGLVKRYISSIDWGYFHSNKKNRALHRHYYERVTEEDYFYDYDDNAKMIFANLNHIGIYPTLTYLPLNLLTEVPIT